MITGINTESCGRSSDLVSTPSTAGLQVFVVGPPTRHPPGETCPSVPQPPSPTVSESQTVRDSRVSRPTSRPGAVDTLEGPHPRLPLRSPELLCTRVIYRNLGFFFLFLCRCPRPDFQTTYHKTPDEDDVVDVTEGEWKEKGGKTTLLQVLCTSSTFVKCPLCKSVVDLRW